MLITSARNICLFELCNLYCVRLIGSTFNRMQDLSKLMLCVCGSVLNRSEQLLFSATPNRYMEFLTQFFSRLIISRRIQNREFHQMKLSKASAGSDLTVSSLRPDDFIGFDSGVKAGYVVTQRGSTSGECWER